MNTIYKKQRLIEIKNEIGIGTYLLGRLKMLQYKKIQKEYGINIWHITPIELRPYAMHIVSELNELFETDMSIKGCVEIGCGLGDIIRNINTPKKYGYDISADVINAAKYIDKKHTTEYFVGSFQDVNSILFDNIVLVAVNFIHNIDADTLKQSFSCVTQSKHISYIVIDSVEGKDYRYHHDYKYILPNYELLKQIYSKNGREVLLLAKIKNEE